MVGKAPARPATGLTKTTDDSKLTAALRAPRLIHQGEEDLKQALRYAYTLVGLTAKSYPTGLEKELLHAYILAHYGNHTAAEVRLAFDMAVQNKLSLKREDAKCYDNFSIAYFCLIMESYREWATEQVRRLPAPTAEREMTPQRRLMIDLDYLHYQLTLLNKPPYLLKLHA